MIESDARVERYFAIKAHEFMFSDVFHSTGIHDPSEHPSSQAFTPVGE